MQQPITDEKSEEAKAQGVEESREEGGGEEMTKAEFAEQVRRSTRGSKVLPPKILAMLNKVDDDYIFDTYLNVRCKDCGNKLAEGLDVEQILAESRSLDDFFDLCADAKECAHTFARVHWPEELDVR